MSNFAFMKKDDFSIKFVVVPHQVPKITDNLLMDEVVKNIEHSPFDYEQPITNVSSKEESYIKAFFRGELALLKFKPYKNLPIALRALDIFTGFTSCSLKFNEDLDTTANNLIRCCFLLKVLHSFQEHEKQFKDNYFLYFENKILWDEKRWCVRYFKQMYKFVIRSGAQTPSISSLHSQVYSLIREIISKFPRLRAEDLLYRIYRIAESSSLDDGL